jgi:2'-5' RNA ligase
MRLFVGVELDDRTRAAAADVAERLRQRIQRIDRNFVARWVDPANLHVTLWFLGELKDDRGEAVSGALQSSPFSTASFELALAGSGVFPPSGSPRVLWIGVRHGAPEMARLYHEIGGRLAPLAFEPERRGYTAHLTIARVKETDRGLSEQIRGAVAGLPSDCGSFRVSTVTLFRSRLSPRGAAYEPLLRVPLS